MRLHSLRLQNFRQHVDTRLEFAPGLTGIIGPNGAGKTTILEAIAWALYGNPAARGNRDSIRFSRAKDRSPVRVELVFELAGHRYRVVRGLTSAECYQDSGETPVANSITGVTELLQRRLGMTRSEFFHTYFTGQKELDVMSSLGPAERARFLSRVLGYDRITAAQELARDRRKSLQAELNGLRHGMPDHDAVWRMVADAEARVAAATLRAADSAEVQQRASAALDAIAPRWAVAQQERERAQALNAELQVVTTEAQARSRDVERLQREIESITAAQREMEPLALQIQSLPAKRAELAQLDLLAAEEATRQALLARVRTLADEQARMDDRLTKLESAPALEVETTALLASARDAVQHCERELDEQRTLWARDRQEAETRLDALRTQYADLARQRDTLEGLGEESPCPTCGRPLGASYRGVLDLLSEQVETVRIDGNYYRARVEQLSRLPDPIEELETRRKVAQAEVSSQEKRLARIQSGVHERQALLEQRHSLVQKLDEARNALAAQPMGYDPAHHKALRADVAALTDIERRIAKLSSPIEREPVTRAELERAISAREGARNRILELEQLLAGNSLGEAEYHALRTAHERASSDARRAELEAVAAQADAERARGELASAEQRKRELAQLQERLTQLEEEKKLHDELDRAYTDIRTDLNFQLRPELSDLGSRFLDSLTDGRYSSLELDDEYKVLVVEEGLPKPVISGGEEDLCNLVLRLAISQMIAERAGQSFSLLVLDEVFGSLDDARRANVVELLRRLNDRFEQVIVITHIDQVRDGLDRVIQVSYDEATGASSVSVGNVSASEATSADSISSTAESLFAELT